MHNVQITLVTPDHKNLACAMAGELKGLHCAFESRTDPSPKGGDARADEMLLQPITTTVACKFKAIAKARTASVQWKPGESWFPGNGWPVGTLTDCGIVTPWP